jgi:hypothetical protein
MPRLLRLAAAAATSILALGQVSLDSLRPSHPRLIALDDDIARVKAVLARDAFAREVHARLAASARKIEAEPPVVYRIVGPRLLEQSRRALERIYTLAFLYRLDGDRRYFDRALKELRAAAAFRDWNPSHFLDTAEMTHAFAIGYDWLYHALSPQDREWIRAAIVAKGIEPALGIYENRRSWTLVTHNWNQVCNGGITLGALAIAEDEPSRAERVLRSAVESIPRAMNSYAPDGGWNEGPGYWAYATRYTVAFLAGLETALGTDFGLSRSEGFDRAGRFRVDFSSPSGKTFNYADAGDAVGLAPAMFWLARRFNEPVYAWHHMDLLKAAKSAHPTDLVWWPDSTTSPAEAGWPLDRVYEGVQTAFLRGSWTDPDAVWVAIKGGDNKANHSHLDLGAFVLDAWRTRWATDLGPDDYNLPHFFGKLRWTYYRLRTESHNTVLVGGENQDPSAAAPIVARDFQPSRASVTIDLTAAYPGRLSRHLRTLTLEDRRRVLVRDDLEAHAPVEMLWGMLTEAEVSLEGENATLSRNRRTLKAAILSPKGAKFDVVSATPPKPQRQNEGVRKLVVRLPAATRAALIEVALSP